jgi:hypothetical protein
MNKFIFSFLLLSTALFTFVNISDVQSLSESDRNRCAAIYNEFGGGGGSGPSNARFWSSHCNNYIKDYVNGSSSGGSSFTGSGGSAGTFTGLADEGCGRYSKGSFLWKPVSESNGKLVVLIPSVYTGHTKRNTARILSEGGSTIETGNAKAFTGANGDREHYSFDKAGYSYPKNIYFAIDLNGGGTAKWRIENDITYSGRGCEGTVSAPYKDTATVAAEIKEAIDQDFADIADRLSETIQNNYDSLEDTNTVPNRVIYQDTIPMRYTYEDGLYELSGYLVLPTCYDYDIDLDNDGDEWRIDITTEKDPNETCDYTDIDTIIFEEEIDHEGNIDLVAYIDDVKVELRLFNETSLSSSSNSSYDYELVYSNTNDNIYTNQQNTNTNNTEDEADLEAIINILIAIGVIPADKISQLESTFNRTFARPQPTTTPTQTQYQSTTQTTSNSVGRTSTLLGGSRNLSVFTGYNRDLDLGSVGTDVQQLQRFLNNNGYTIANSGAGSPGNESTYFGPATRSALIRFQQANNITPASGYFGPVTRGLVE